MDRRLCGPRANLDVAMKRKVLPIMNQTLAVQPFSLDIILTELSQLLQKQKQN